MALLLTTSSLASAQNKTPAQLRAERKLVKEERAQKQGQIDALTSDADKLVAAINTLVAARDSAQEAVNATERQVNTKLEQLIAVQEQIRIFKLNVAETEELLRKSAVAEYRGYQGPNSEQNALSLEPTQYAETQALRRFVNLNTEDLLDELRADAAELEALQAEADRTLREVEALRDQARQRQAVLDMALIREDEALDAVENRLDARLFEAATLEQLDAELANQIKAEELRIAQAIARAARARQRAARNYTLPTNADFELTTVEGITVNTEIADAVRAIVLEMRQRGFNLRGWGFRTNIRQIELRREHCGSSDWSVYQKPASQCRPPTARPGRSLHEVGLAVDFIHNGRVIRSRNSAAFRALQEVAPKYGLYNLPSEPWHWSTTGG